MSKPHNRFLLGGLMTLAALTAGVIGYAASERQSVEQMPMSIDGERAGIILKGGEGRRLTYRRPDRIAA